ncbi:MAG: hypothetical protein H6714_07780 [Myxococcales bacterium]|nr:hypothetical protein [Myxococcales bacterium]
MNDSFPRKPVTPLAGYDIATENNERLEARLHQEIQRSRELEAELRHHQAVLRDYLTVRESSPGITSSVRPVSSAFSGERELAFLRGECAGLRMRLGEQRVFVSPSLDHIEPEEHHRARLALAQALTLKEEAEGRAKALEAQLNGLLGDNTHRALIMESMAAQLEVRDERIRALESSFESPELLESTLETQALQDALLQLQEQVVALSEELAAKGSRGPENT